MSEAVKPPTAQNNAAASDTQNKRKKRTHRNNKHARRGRPRRQNQYNSNINPAQPQSKRTCSECQAEQPKYKCPNCRAAYCSIACCRAHKEKPCNEQGSNNEHEPMKSKYLPSAMSVSANNSDQLCTGKSQFKDLEEGWKIADSMKLAMEQTPWLRNELADGGLRHVIAEIMGRCSRPANQSHDACTHLQAVALDQAKLKYPNFGVFLDKLLVVTGVLERESQQEDLSVWLTRNNQGEHDGLGYLVMKSMDRRQRPPKQKEDEGPSASSSDDNDSSSEDGSDSDSS